MTADEKFVGIIEHVLNTQPYPNEENTRRLISIIRKQQKALEKCKEQRDEYIPSHIVRASDMKSLKRICDEELSEILEA